MGTFTRNLELVERLAHQLLDPARPPELRAWGHLSLADLALARGRWRAAHEELRRAESFAPLRALELRGFYATLPFLSPPRADLLALRFSLLGWDPGPDPAAISPPFAEFYPGARPAVRLYVLGLLSLRLGEDREAERYAHELESFQTSPVARSYARLLAQGVRAHLARTRRRPEVALAALRSGDPGLPRDYTPVHFTTQAAERYLRAEILLELGHYEEALGWYRSLREATVGDLVYLGPTLLRQGEIHERLGNPGKAAEHYAHFVELWKDCDPELRPLREQAEGRLARIRKAGVGGKR